MAYLEKLAALKTDRRAVTVIEYALIASLVAISIVLGATAIGGKLSAIFYSVLPGL